VTVPDTSILAAATRLAREELEPSVVAARTGDRMLETIGKSALGLTEAMFRVSAGSQGA
jgi:hypothetical protein